MPSKKSQGRRGHRPESQERYPGYINYERSNGSQEIGARAVAAALYALFTGGKETEPTDPRARSGITFHHDDGSYDTGTRAVANAVRIAKYKDPKIYPRTMRPLDP